jgi:hypothetical protein
MTQRPQQQLLLRLLLQRLPRVRRRPLIPMRRLRKTANRQLLRRVTQHRLRRRLRLIPMRLRNSLRQQRPIRSSV